MGHLQILSWNLDGIALRRCKHSRSRLPQIARGSGNRVHFRTDIAGDPLYGDGQSYQQYWRH